MSSDDIIRVFRVNLVLLNMGEHTIEPSGTFYHFHPDCYDRWFKRQSRSGGLSFSSAELEIDKINMRGIDCHSCKRPIVREVITL